MHDTSPEIMRKMHELIQQKTPLERAKMGSSMHQTSRQLIIRAILQKNPSITPAGLRRELFLKFYGNDYSPLQREKIVQSIEAYSLKFSS